MPKIAVVSVHVETHPKYQDVHAGHCAFVELLRQYDLPPMSLHWLREKDDPSCPDPEVLRRVPAIHEIGLHYHTLIDGAERAELTRKVTKEKALLERALGRRVTGFSSGHFGMAGNGPAVLSDTGFHV